MSADSKYTAGPWHIGFSDGTGRAYILGSKLRENSDLPEVVVSGATDDWGTEHGVRREADRRLIVEAPEMLELVKLVAAGNKPGVRSQKRAQALLARVAGAP